MKKVLCHIYKSTIFLLFLFVQISATLNVSSGKQRLTVVLIVDQFSNHYMKRLGNNFNYAFKELAEKGVYFTDAHHPHGTPTTATGHNALNTGTLACNHGIILNSWDGPDGKKLRYDIDPDPQNAAFSIDGLQKTGNSTKNIMTTGLTDQFVMGGKNHKTFSLSYKSRAAIGMSGKGGQPIWFDSSEGIFTSSLAFFDKLPEWLMDFNYDRVFDELNFPRKWRLFYPRNSKYYDLKDINFHEETNYKYAKYNESLIANDIICKDLKSLDRRIRKRGLGKNYETYLKSPFANALLLELVKSCIKNNLKEDDNMLLWVSLSPLDKLGHVYGPHSLEVIDMIYHLDKQIWDFLNYLKEEVGEDNFMFILTADHGMEPLVEVMQNQGVDAHRILTNELVKEMNEHVKNNYNIDNLVRTCKASQFYLYREKLNCLDPDLKDKIINDLKNIILNKKGTRYVWYYEEFKNLDSEFDTPKNFYAKQYYEGRSGDLICMPERYSYFTPYDYGAGHRASYDFTTNVPLIFYQKGVFENKVIDRKVWMPQLPVTIAKLLEVGRPASSDFLPLSFE